MRNGLITILLLVSLSATSQKEVLNTIDSLERQLEDSQDSSRVDLLNALAVHYYNVDLKQSLELGQSALDLAKELIYYKGIQQAYNILRRVHRRLGNYSVAIEYTLQNLSISEQLGDSLELLNSYLVLGNINSSIENFTEAQRYLMRAHALGKKLNSPQLANILNFIGRSYGKMGNYDSGQFYIQAALLREIELPQPGYALSYIYNNLAEIYYYKKEYVKAIEFYSLSSGLSDEKKSEYGMTFTLNGLALVYKGLQEYDKAIGYALQSIEISKNNSFRDKAKEAYGILYEIHEEKEEYKKALEYYKEYKLFQDSIFSEDRIQYIENLKINYETDKIASENELLRKDAQLKNTQLKQQVTLAWIGIAAIILLSGVSILLYRVNKQRRKAIAMLKEHSHDLKIQVDKRTKELSDSNLELIKQNNQLEQFGYIVAHNLRSPVARLLGLSNLITGKKMDQENDQQAILQLQASVEELDTTITDLNAILKIKKGIHTSYEEVSFPDRLEKVKNILQDKIQESNATIEDSFSIQTCFAIPAYIESILYNLISNAIKYRALDRLPVIQIGTSRHEDQILLNVQDNGIGIDLEKQKEKVFTLYQRFHHHVEGKGLGLFLVKTQVEALNGSIELESNVNIGTTFKIYLPLKPEIPTS